jgi:hypothetical protein
MIMMMMMTMMACLPVIAFEPWSVFVPNRIYRVTLMNIYVFISSLMLKREHREPLEKLKGYRILMAMT